MSVGDCIYQKKTNEIHLLHSFFRSRFFLFNQLKNKRWAKVEIEVMLKQVQNLDQNRIPDHDHVHYHQHHRKNLCFFDWILLIFNSGRAATAPKWDGESGYRLHVSPLNPRTSRRDIEKIFTKFGTINEVCFSETTQWNRF